MTAEEVQFQRRNQYQFESFCKKVIHSERCDYLRWLLRYTEREISFSDLPASCLERLGAVRGCSGEEYIFNVCGYCVPIQNERLADSLLALASEGRSILILYYSLGLSDREISELLDTFCDFLTEQGKAENTVKAYRQAVDEYIKWYESTFDEQFQKLYKANMLDYISYLRTVRKLANRSVNAKLAALQSLNGHLIEAGIQTDAVLTKRDYLKVQTTYANPSTVSREQVEAFRKRVLVGNGTWDHAIIAILAYAGLRISECLTLFLEDVSLTTKKITVRHGKGDKMRVVFIGDKVVNAVREYLKERPDNGSPYLFVSRRGGSLSRGQANRTPTQAKKFDWRYVFMEQQLLPTTWGTYADALDHYSYVRCLDTGNLYEVALLQNASGIWRIAWTQIWNLAHPAMIRIPCSNAWAERL